MEKVINKGFIIFALVYLFASAYNILNKNNYNSSVFITEPIQQAFVTTKINNKKPIIIKNTNKEFIPLIPFVSQHWGLPFSKANKIVHYAFKYGRKYHVSPLYVLAEIATESSFQYSAYSNLSAVGIMQIYPKAHWRYVIEHHYVGKRYYRLFRLKDNIKFGTYILAKDLRVFGSMQSASAHYFGICSFDKTYVKRVMTNYELMHRHYY